MNFKIKKYIFKFSVVTWLTTLTIMVFLMILIGGLTRLTESGLSIIEWKPILGILPPFNSSDWAIAFSKYQNSPEFKIVNSSMQLIDFKYIFWWEWSHRFFARFIGIFFLIPMMIFIIQKKISKNLLINLLFLFIFGIFQSIIGWWMVKSGLDQNPYVSSYRLAFHLTNAVIIISVLFWLTINSFYKTKLKFIPTTRFEYVFFTLIMLILLTIVSGAFMAGSDAGKSFNTYPLMNGSFIPDGYFLESYGFRNFFENTIAINFNHRWLATFTFISIVCFTIYLFSEKNYNKYNFKIKIILFFSCMQFVLGILTLLTNVKVYLASLHQVNSLLLLASLIYMYHSVKKQKVL